MLSRGALASPPPQKNLCARCNTAHARHAFLSPPPPPLLSLTSSSPPSPYICVCVCVCVCVCIYQVDTVRLDDVVTESPTLIKIDAQAHTRARARAARGGGREGEKGICARGQGHEFHVLLGAEEILRRVRDPCTLVRH